ncbi:MAG: FAD-dependent oxidoreductase, partial [Candidatus Bipolaricaulota bacterium]
SLLIDDKAELGGKLLLQTHRFFGSREAVFAGTRGIEIAGRLEEEASALPAVELWRRSTALAVYSDGIVGVVRAAHGYINVRPQALLVAAGAREKSLLFPGHTLPGVYGAGAFQTLVNRDRVRPSERLFIVGGGNVGLITGYHALQAGIDVVGLIEILPACGGYKVHRDKLARLGVPIHTSHTVLSVNGTREVESITIAAVGPDFAPLPGSERSYACDTVLIAVGLDPVDEIYRQAKRFGLSAFAAGDADEIAEASAAIFSGRIRAVETARALGKETGPVPDGWVRTLEILKSAGGAVFPPERPPAHRGVLPVFHCAQEIPCDPCSQICPQSLIAIRTADIRGTPAFLGIERDVECTGCARCVTACPGLAVSLVDYRSDPESPTVTLPFEFDDSRLGSARAVTALDDEGEVLGVYPVLELSARREGTSLLRLQAPAAVAPRIAGVRVQPDDVGTPFSSSVSTIGDEIVVCRCERVTVREIRALIAGGCRDVNEIKAVTRAGMGACGGKTCAALILRLFREAGASAEEITENVRRPLFVEIPLGAFAGVEGDEVG